MAGTDDIVALPAIEADDLDPTRQYIPLPGGWEVQTRGRGSSYRLLDRKTGERRPILGSEPQFIQDFVTRMALEVHAATSTAATALAERDAQIERLTRERDERNKLAIERAARAASAEARATTAERERDEARAEVERLKKAVSAVTDAMGAYLPPDGISASECISRILGATDNPKINAIMLENNDVRPQD